MGARVDPSSLPIDDSNLCIKAARALLADAGCRKGVHITLIKRVPFEAGLGGGSADAAAVLNGLNELLGLSYTKEKLAEIGLSVGADVPEGIGERITPIEAAVEDVSVLLVKPDFGAATGGIYSAFDALSDPLHPDIDGLIRALCAGDLPQAAGKMGNALEGVTAASHPEMEEIKEEIKKAGALAAAMTGSGPTIFGLFSDADLCRQAAALLFEAHRDWFVCECGFTNSRRPASD